MPAKHLTHGFRTSRVFRQSRPCLEQRFDRSSMISGSPRPAFFRSVQSPVKRGAIEIAVGGLQWWAKRENHVDHFAVAVEGGPVQRRRVVLASTIHRQTGPE